MDKYHIKGYRRHKTVYSVGRRLIAPAIRHKMAYSTELFEPLNRNYIVVANHTTNLDPLLIALSFKSHMYFVASEHILSNRLASIILRFFADPIIRVKGGSAPQTVRDILRRTKAGSNICIFAEGTRTYNGRTEPIVPATGRLIQKLRLPLITFRFEGGYFTSPRWGTQIRRGGMCGHVVNIYQPEQLSGMTGQEINELIAEDIKEDAYNRQIINLYNYHGKRPAEHLEYLLCVCPHCRSIDSLISRDNMLTCTSCGLQITYLETGFLKNSPIPTITEWDSWQTKHLQNKADLADSEPIISNSNEVLRTITDDHQRQIVSQGQLALYRSKLVCGNIEFDLANIQDMSIVSTHTLVFKYGNVNYDLGSTSTHSMYKYLILFKYLKEKTDNGLLSS